MVRSSKKGWCRNRNKSTLQKRRENCTQFIVQIWGHGMVMVMAMDHTMLSLDLCSIPFQYTMPGQETSNLHMPMPMTLQMIGMWMGLQQVYNHTECEFPNKRDDGYENQWKRECVSHGSCSWSGAHHHQHHGIGFIRLCL